MTLLLAVLISELADRSVLSTTVLFLLAGVVVGEGGLGVVPLHPDNPVVATFAELALFSMRFSDGMRAGIRDLASAWRLPGRDLLLGLPLTLLHTAALARGRRPPLAGVAVPGRGPLPDRPGLRGGDRRPRGVPERLRRLLNVESGLNDGPALPLVVGLLAYAGREDLLLRGLAPAA